jgi:hypothetical protein
MPHIIAEPAGEHRSAQGEWEEPAQTLRYLEGLSTPIENWLSANLMQPRPKTDELRLLCFGSEGLESNPVLLYAHNLGSMPDEELLVGVSRARLYLAIVIDSRAERTLSMSARRFLRDAVQHDTFAESG